MITKSLEKKTHIGVDECGKLLAKEVFLMCIKNFFFIFLGG